MSPSSKRRTIRQLPRRRRSCWAEATSTRSQSSPSCRSRCSAARWACPSSWVSWWRSWPTWRCCIQALTSSVVSRWNGLTCISHHPTAEAHDTSTRTSLRLLAVLDVLSSTPARAKRRAPFSSARLAPSPDGPLTHFASPRGEKCRLRQLRSKLEASKGWHFRR